MLYVRFPLSLRNVEDLLHERGVDVSYESVRYCWHRFGHPSCGVKARLVGRYKAKTLAYVGEKKLTQELIFEVE